VRLKARERVRDRTKHSFAVRCRSLGRRIDESNTGRAASLDRAAEQSGLERRVPLQDHEVLGLRQKARGPARERRGRPQLGLLLDLLAGEREVDRQLDKRQDGRLIDLHRQRIDRLGGNGDSLRPRPTKRNHLRGDTGPDALLVNCEVNRRPNLVTPVQRLTAQAHATLPSAGQFSENVVGESDGKVPRGRAPDCRKYMPAASAAVSGTVASTRDGGRRSAAIRRGSGAATGAAEPAAPGAAPPEGGAAAGLPAAAAPAEVRPYGQDRTSASGAIFISRRAKRRRTLIARLRLRESWERAVGSGS